MARACHHQGCAVSGGLSSRAAQLLAAQQQSRRHSVIVLSYEALRADAAALAAIPWLYMVLDEGHIIRNPATKVAAAAKQVGAAASHRLILSGTPIQVMRRWRRRRQASERASERAINRPISLPFFFFFFFFPPRTPPKSSGPCSTF